MLSYLKSKLMTHPLTDNAESRDAIASKNQEIEPKFQMFLEV